MPRRRVVTNSYANIVTRIEEIDQQVADMTAKIKELKAEKKTLEKDAKAAQEKEAEEAKKKMIEELADLMKEKGITVDKIKELL